MRRMRRVGWRGVRFSGVGISGSFVFVVDVFFSFFLVFFLRLWDCGFACRLWRWRECGHEKVYVLRGGGICNCASLLYASGSGSGSIIDTVWLHATCYM